MKTTSLITLLVITSSTLFGCGNQQEIYTTDYLYANDDIRAKVLAECAENKQSDTNCKNANEADGKKKVDEYRKQTNR